MSGLPPQPTAAGASPQDATLEASGLVSLLAPAEPVPPVVQDEGRLAMAAAALAGGTGPLAIDAERASGYRYGQRAYLVQLRRQGAGTWLVDPITCPDLGPVAEAVAGVEWVLHAATQDLPCLAEVGLRPSSLFDTELGARLVGLPRVGLSAVAEHYLGLSLAKEHSAVDWSTRPLPEPWLRYAALDVELLVPLRNAIEADLREAGKLDWARQEFDALLGFTGPPSRTDPWRRTSGMHRVTGRRGAALVRELWLARDRLAAERDQAPGRVLPDSALVELALTAPRRYADLPQRGIGSRLVKRYARHWLAAVDEAMRLPERDLPVLTSRPEGPPPPRSWAERDPAAATRLATARALLAGIATRRSVPVEHLVAPELVRRLAWQPLADTSVDSIAGFLAAAGARPWQVQLTAPLLAQALAEPPAAGVVTDQ
ncbi:MAG TPA: HRDC domain-containing protein [Dermatophilaceae bacterium]|nr:HRDC domain-containing protein [Dermatophilaceae bacterium]